MNFHESGQNYSKLKNCAQCLNKQTFFKMNFVKNLIIVAVCKKGLKRLKQVRPIAQKIKIVYKREILNSKFFWKSHAIYIVFSS